MADLMAVLSAAQEKENRKQLLQSIDKKFEKRVYGLYGESRNFDERDLRSYNPQKLLDEVLSEIGGRKVYRSTEGCENFYLLPYNSDAITLLSRYLLILDSDSKENMENLVRKIDDSLKHRYFSLRSRYGSDYIYDRWVVDEKKEKIELGD